MNETDANIRCLSISAAAKALHIRREVIRAAVERGDLPMRRVPGRKRPVILLSDLQAWLRSLEVA